MDNRDVCEYCVDPGFIQSGFTDRIHACIFSCAPGIKRIDFVSSEENIVGVHRDVPLCFICMGITVIAQKDNSIGHNTLCSFLLGAYKFTDEIMTSTLWLHACEDSQSDTAAIRFNKNTLFFAWIRELKNDQLMFYSLCIERAE